MDTNTNTNTNTNDETTARTACELIADILSWNDELGVTPFDEAGILTTNEGMVVTLEDGSEFQITIVRSR